jgi:hypothetical protein
MERVEPFETQDRVETMTPIQYQIQAKSRELYNLGIRIS